MRVEEAIGSTGQRGEFLYFSRSCKVIVREWSTTFRRFLPLPDDETLRYIAGVYRADFFHNLGPYPQSMRAQWSSLTSHISAACVKRVEPIGSCLEAQGMPLTEEEQKMLQQHQQQQQQQLQQLQHQQQQRLKLRKGRGTEEADKQILNFKKTDEEETEEEEETDCKEKHQRAKTAFGEEAEERHEKEREVREAAEAASCKMFYCDLKPAKTDAVRAARAAAAATRRSGGDAAAAAAAAAAAVTQQCTDRTDTLLQLIQELPEGYISLLGELQIAFIALVLGHHFPSLLHWRRLVDIFTTSERAVYLLPGSYAAAADAAADAAALGAAAAAALGAAAGAAVDSVAVAAADAAALLGVLLQSCMKNTF